MIQSYKDLNVYTASYSLAMDVFWMTKNPLTDLKGDG